MLVMPNELGAAANRQVDVKEDFCSVALPNTGIRHRQVPLAGIPNTFRKVIPDEAKPVWKELYTASKTDCFHKYWFVQFSNFTER